jgi:hypothetical protein
VFAPHNASIQYETQRSTNTTTTNHNKHQHTNTKMTKQMPKDTLSRSLTSLKCLLLLLLVALLLPLQAAAAMDPMEPRVVESVAQQRRNKQAKMWYLSRIQVGDNMKLPFSPVTLAIIFFSVYYLISNWNGSGRSSSSGTFCEASHILMDHSDAAEKTLKEYKEKIKDDLALFAKHASKFSACSSKNNGGNLVS